MNAKNIKTTGQNILNLDAYSSSAIANPIAQYAFLCYFRPGETPYDIVSGTSMTTTIPGTRYDLVNGTHTSFANNVPVITENGIRGVGAYTNKFIHLTILVGGQKEVLQLLMVLIMMILGAALMRHRFQE